MRSKNLKTLLIIIVSYSLLLLMDYGYQHDHTSSICIVKNITSYPCPGCGLGRATLDILHGNIIHSFQYNIIAIPFTFTILLSTIWLVVDLVNRRDSFFRTINRRVAPIYLLPFFALAIISWIVNIIRGI